MDSPRIVEKSKAEAEPGSSPGIPACPRTLPQEPSPVFSPGESRRTLEPTTPEPTSSAFLAERL